MIISVPFVAVLPVAVPVKFVATSIGNGAVIVTPSKVKFPFVPGMIRMPYVVELPDTVIERDVLIPIILLVIGPVRLPEALRYLMLSLISS